MAVVGDRVQVPTKRVGQTPREGVVVAVTGSLLRVRWAGGEESTIMPSMGSLVVVGRAKVRPQKAGPKGATSKSAGAKPGPGKASTVPAKSAAKGAGGSKSGGGRAKASAKGAAGGTKRRK